MISSTNIFHIEVGMFDSFTKFLASLMSSAGGAGAGGTGPGLGGVGVGVGIGVGLILLI